MLVATIAGLPVADPQFWLATGLVAGVVALAVLRLRRRRRASPAACASCPKAAVVPPPAARR